MDCAVVQHTRFNSSLHKLMADNQRATSSTERLALKVCRVTWSGPHQGLAAHVERYRNSPVMHRPEAS